MMNKNKKEVKKSLILFNPLDGRMTVPYSSSCSEYWHHRWKRNCIKNYGVLMYMVYYHISTPIRIFHVTFLLVLSIEISRIQYRLVSDEYDSQFHFTTVFFSFLLVFGWTDNISSTRNISLERKKFSFFLNIS